MIKQHTAGAGGTLVNGSDIPCHIPLLGEFGNLFGAFFQIKNRWFIGGAVLAALHGIGHSAETGTAPTFNLNLLLEAKEFFDNFAVKFEGIGLVGA